ncbi:MAG TPA: hypothetical protein GXX18_13950 [Bacillales bacterium]|nr:hypothetical protein [Bacillales bacterium]
MQIYKLFSQSPYAKKLRFSDFSTRVITGDSEVAFGLRVEPEHYREFMNSISNHLLKNKISQHIMTDFKFIEFIRQSRKLNFELTDILFYNEEQYGNDELISELKENFWDFNLEQILVLLDEAINNGYKIFSITGNFQNSKGEYEQIKIYANGTLSIENNFDEVSKYPIIDYLIKGPEVLL